MKVEVIAEKWGLYKSGDIIPSMPDSTALACIKSGVVKSLEYEEAPKKEKSNNYKK